MISISQLGGPIPFSIASVITFVYIFLAMMATVPVARKRKQGLQSLNKAFIAWLYFTMAMTIIRFTEYIFIMENGVLPGSFYIGASLSTWYLIPMLSVMAQFQFVLYIMRKYKYYSIPAILTFFVSLGLFQYDSHVAYDILMIPIAYLPAGLFFWKGIKNKDGLTFSLGLYTTFDYILPYWIYSPMKFVMNAAGSDIYYVFIIGALIAATSLNLGTWGWFDRHVFYDKEREKQIKNAWVSRLIEIEKKKPDVKKTQGKSIVLECPICHRQGRKQFAHEIVLERARNEKGIVKMLLNQEKEICEHQFVAYVDRSFSIRGYEVIDMMV
ncbi:MAG: hypothetical protein GYA24_25695 [Candidatus Lokiarchaeota archaeon]|nr:hypothetical protein [Candidatus Lokiarchaeota archaeon]